MDGLDIVDDAPPQVQPSQPIEPVTHAPQPEPSSPSESDQFAGLNLQETESGPDLDAIAAIRNARNKKRAKASAKIAKASRKSTRAITGERGAATGLAIGAGKIPLALATSLGFGIGVCIAWTILASLTGWIFVYVAVGVAAAAAYGLVMYTEERNAGLGVAAIFIALFCIFMGKFMIGKWVVMPMIEEEFNAGFAEGMEEETYTFNDMTQEEKEYLLDTPMEVYNIGVMELWDRGELDEMGAKELISAQYKNIFTEEELVAEGYEAEHQTVHEQIESWDETNKMQMFEKHYDTCQTYCMDWLMDSSLVQGIGLFIAFIAAFSFWDLIILPFACITAYKIAAGTN
jgi:hypothetical protein